MELVFTCCFEDYEERRISQCWSMPTFMKDVLRRFVFIVHQRIDESDD